MKCSVGVLIVLFFLNSCTVKQAKGYHNGDIKQTDKTAINSEVKLIINAIANKDAATLQRFCSDKLTEKEKIIVDSLVANVELSPDIQVHALEQYLIINSGEKDIEQITTDDLGQNNFNLKFRALGAYTYVYIADLSEANSNLKRLLTCTFDKDNGKWKITGLYVGLYKYKDHTALELYNKSLHDTSKENRFNKLLTIQVCIDLSTPVGTALHYKSGNDIFNNKDSIVSQIQRDNEVPKFVTSVSTAPEILNIFPQLIQGDFHAFIVYKSSIPVQNVEALTKENDALNSVINKELPGVAQFSDTIVYRVVNGDINSPGHYKYYGFVKKVTR